MTEVKQGSTDGIVPREPHVPDKEKGKVILKNLATLKSHIQEDTSAQKAPQFPLPPKTSAKTVPAAKVRLPHSGSQFRVWLVFVPMMAGMISIAAVGLGGIWLKPQPRDVVFSQNLQATPAAKVPAAQVIPGQFLAIIHYHASSPEDRVKIAGWWEQSKSSTDWQAFLKGDPRLVLGDPQVNDVFYVMLAQSDTPYVLLTDTPSVRELVAGPNMVATIAQQDGWLIVHQEGTQLYTEALAAQTLDETPQRNQLAERSVGAPLAIVLSQDVWPHLAHTYFGKNIFTQTKAGLSLSASPLNDQPAFAIQGQTHPQILLSADIVNQTLLSLVPSDAQAVILGGNFWQDLDDSKDTLSVLDKNIFQDEEVIKFLAQITTPYVIYTRPVTDKKAGFTMVIELPFNVAGLLQLGDPVLERALLSLAVYHGKVPQQLALPSPSPVPPPQTEEKIATTSPQPVSFFSEGEAQNIPLRFINIQGPEQAIDYTIFNRFLIMATSKEDMMEALAVTSGAKATFIETPSWSKAQTQQPLASTASHVMMGYTAYTPLARLMPATLQKSFISLSFTPQRDKTAVQGIMSW